LTHHEIYPGWAYYLMIFSKCIELCSQHHGLICIGTLLRVKRATDWMPGSSVNGTCPGRSGTDLPTWGHVPGTCEPLSLALDFPPMSSLLVMPQRPTKLSSHHSSASVPISGSQRVSSRNIHGLPIKRFQTKSIFEKNFRSQASMSLIFTKCFIKSHRTWQYLKIDVCIQYPFEKWTKNTARGRNSFYYRYII